MTAEKLLKQEASCSTNRIRIVKSGEEEEKRHDRALGCTGCSTTGCGRTSILFVVCLVIDIIALGLGIVWLVRYILSIEGSGMVISIVAGSLVAIVVYCVLWAGFSLRYETED